MRGSNVLYRLQELFHIELFALIITDDEIGFLFFGRFERPLFIGRVNHLIPVPEERLRHRRNAQQIVIDNEYFLRLDFSHLIGQT